MDSFGLMSIAGQLELLAEEQMAEENWVRYTKDITDDEELKKHLAGTREPDEKTEHFQEIENDIKSNVALYYLPFSNDRIGPISEAIDPMDEDPSEQFKAFVTKPHTYSEYASQYHESKLFAEAFPNSVQYKAAKRSQVLERIYDPFNMENDIEQFEEGNTYRNGPFEAFLNHEDSDEKDEFSPTHATSSPHRRPGPGVPAARGAPHTSENSPY